MKFLAQSSEPEMIATFLQAELHSERFGHELRHLMRRDNVPDAIVEQADMRNAAENEYRRQLFSEFRGYPNKQLE